MTRDHDLLVMDRATRAIEKVATIGEAKALADQAGAIRLLAAKQRWSHDQQHRIAEIELRATRRLGELLQETPKNVGVRMAGSPKGSIGGSQVEPPIDTP